MRTVPIIICLLIIVFTVYLTMTDGCESLTGSGASQRNPPLILLAVLAVIGLIANLRKQ